MKNISFEYGIEKKKARNNAILLALILITIAIVIPVVGSKMVERAENSMYYAPGETLDPNCSPQDPRCGVRH